jgi:hypothetical protein
MLEVYHVSDLGSMCLWCGWATWNRYPELSVRIGERLGGCDSLNLVSMAMVASFGAAWSGYARTCQMSPRIGECEEAWNGYPRTCQTSKNQ